MAVDLSSQNRAASPLLATRFFPPPLPVACVPRLRLMERMQQGLRVPVTLISAPPGFGKSTIISQWMQHAVVDEQANSTGPLKAGWLSLEPSDQDWGTFFRYLVAAWQRVYPQIGWAALEAWKDAPTMRRESLLDLLLNDLTTAQEPAEAGHALLVLDDYHRIEAADIHETVRYLVEHLPPGCHLALLTRADPPLPLARWRSRGLLLELRDDDLRFTPPEATEYLNQSLRLGLTAAQIRVLLERTEGWIAGLQMAALSLQGRIKRSLVTGGDAAAGTQAAAAAAAFVRDFNGSNRFVLDYLIEEVFNCQPEEVQQFLLATTLLDKFCGPLCDALLGASAFRGPNGTACPSAPYSQQMLERMEKANLFLIPLNDVASGAGDVANGAGDVTSSAGAPGGAGGGWYRYHHLFADLLRLRLQQTAPEKIPVFYRRAAEWFAKNSLWQDAIRYGLHTKDLDFSAGLVEQAILKGGLDFLFSGIRPLIEPFPAAIVESRPLLSLAKAEVIMESSVLEGVEPLLRFAEEGIRTAPPYPGQEDVLGLVYLIQAEAATQLGDHGWLVEAGRQVPKWTPKDFVTTLEVLIQYGFITYYEGDLNQTEKYWQQALDLSQARNNTYYILCMLNCLARTSYQKGECKRSEALFLQAFDLLEAHPGQYLIWLGAMQRDYADLLRDCNRLEEAHARVSASLPLLEKWHTINAHGYGLFSAARVLLSMGDLPGAHAMLDRLDGLRRRYTLYPDLETLSQTARARVFLEEGQTERAWQLLKTCLNSTDSRHIYLREWVLMPQARILVRTGRPAEALELLAGWLESAKAGGRGRDWLSICLLTALAYEALGDRQQAFQLLSSGLAFAQAQGCRRALIEEGEPMRALLEDFRVQFPQSPLAGYIDEMLPLIPAARAGQPGTSIKVEGLDETLSPREVEILRLVCQGLSNQEIARQLVLSVGTVKFHIHNIFGKLGVRDRPQAIAKAAQLRG